MELKLEMNEVEVLRQSLKLFLSDLRMEISDTESYDFRQGLKQDEVIIKAVLAKLESVGAPA